MTSYFHVIVDREGSTVYDTFAETYCSREFRISPVRDIYSQWISIWSPSS